jgi:hypothetical protein
MTPTSSRTFLSERGILIAPGKVRFGGAPKPAREARALPRSRGTIHH